MDKKELSIVYLGTPDFAVEALDRLVKGGYQVVAVVTTPDKPVGRHQNHLRPSPVKEYALKNGLPLMQPVSLKDEDFLESLRALKADLQIVVAFRMLPEVVWAMPKYGTFNLHASLLPQYRGAAPINWSIINGETQTGITTFFLDKNMDTGEIIDQVTVNIAEEDDFGMLHDRLMTLGGDLVVKTVDRIIDGSIKSQPQLVTEPAALKPAPKIFRETCRIDWKRGLMHVYNLVRGLSPVPAAWTTMQTSTGEETVKIYKTKREEALHNLPIGQVVTDGRSFLKVALDGGYLHLLDLQLAGKKRMLVEDFLRGYKCPETMKMV
ncbi:MAG: methionyl-tRNA formyltransferase [Bacteroidaceae bacterium]|nr:methionyl-tRNA formyltransferase [Bacteroidaceae bacterium]